MSETEEIPQPEQTEQTEPVEPVETTPVVEKVKRERSEAQKAVLEKARAKGLEVRLQKAKERQNGKANSAKKAKKSTPKKTSPTKKKTSETKPVRKLYVGQRIAKYFDGIAYKGGKYHHKCLNLSPLSCSKVVLL